MHKEIEHYWWETIVTELNDLKTLYIVVEWKCCFSYNIFASLVHVDFWLEEWKKMKFKMAKSLEAYECVSDLL